MQAYYVGTIFAALSIFGQLPSNTMQLAFQAIAFQMAVEVSRHFNQAIRWTFVIEIDLVSVQRILTYCELPPEELETKEVTSKDVDGDLEFDNVWMKYQDHLDPAIKGMSFEISKGQKIAIVGRTGAGKSSLF